MAKLRLLLILFALIAAGMTGCASSKDELSRAQQEIDTRQYDRAIERMERLGAENPDIKSSEEYIDLLSSAYLGKSGVDLIDALGHWAETAKSIEGARAGLRPAGGDSAVPVSFQEYKAIVSRLVPPGLGLQGMPTLQKALTLCNDRLRASVQGATVSIRILVKTVFVNFWALLNELNAGMIPAVEMLIAPRVPLEICTGFSRVVGSFQKVTEFGLNIAMSITLLGDHKNGDIESVRNLSKLTESMEWIKQYSSCEQLSDGEIERIKQRFAGG